MATYASNQALQEGELIVNDQLPIRTAPARDQAQHVIVRNSNTHVTLRLDQALHADFLFSKQCCRTFR
jgi:hypothetical protein